MKFQKDRLQVKRSNAAFQLLLMRKSVEDVVREHTMKMDLLSVKMCVEGSIKGFELLIIFRIAF